MSHGTTNLTNQGENYFSLLKIIFLSPKGKLFDVNKTYINISNGQKFELWVIFGHINLNCIISFGHKIFNWSNAIWSCLIHKMPNCTESNIDTAVNMSIDLCLFLFQEKSWSVQLTTMKLWSARQIMLFYAWLLIVGINFYHNWSLDF